MPSYVDSAVGIRSDQLTGGFFVGWPSPPTAERHLDILRGSDAVVIAIEDDAVVGFVTAISEGVLSAFIPLLEVLPAYQHQGIATELVTRLLAQLEGLYMVDVCCDADLEPFYLRLGFHRLERGMGLRRPEKI
jgi:ribosomal protein S18 acetylase RimI-like enzyme